MIEAVGAVKPRQYISVAENNVRDALIGQHNAFLIAGQIAEAQLQITQLLGIGAFDADMNVILLGIVLIQALDYMLQVEKVFYRIIVAGVHDLLKFQLDLHVVV